MFALVTTAFLLVSASSQAQPVTPSSSPSSTPAATSAAPAATAAAPEKKICRREQEAGSMMGKRICYTQSEWDAIGRATGNDAESLLRDYRSRNSSF